MNGVHDLGGMHGFGPVEREENEPVFHADWERLVRAMSAATRANKIYHLDEFRYAVERTEPAFYLESSYYERWLDGLCRLLEEKGVVSAAELERRQAFFEANPEAPATAVIEGPLPEPNMPFVDRSAYSEVPTTTPPKFGPGDQIVTRHFSPRGHTRLPRYARGKAGTIERVHGTFIFPDDNAAGLGEHPQVCYSVRFDGRELWGEDSEPNQIVYLDCFESYLLPR